MVKHIALGESCQYRSYGGVCGDPATHKVEETLEGKKGEAGRHPFTTYLCCFHFAAIMGVVAAKACGVD